MSKTLQRIKIAISARGGKSNRQRRGKGSFRRYRFDADAAFEVADECFDFYFVKPPEGRDHAPLDLAVFTKGFDKL